MAVPPYDGVRPYRQVTFQFSVHVQLSSKADIDRHEFLADGPEKLDAATGGNHVARTVARL